MTKLEDIELNDKNHFIGQDYLYIVKNNDVLRFQIKDDIKHPVQNFNTVFLYSKTDGDRKYIAFGSEKQREIYINKHNTKEVEPNE